MGKYEDHPVIKEARQHHGFEEDADFLTAISETFVKTDPQVRRQSLAAFDKVETSGDLRQEAQLGKVRRHLRGLDERLRKSGL